MISSGLRIWRNPEINKVLYVLIHGARKNAGDFLIRDRAREILQTRWGSPPELELPRWEPLDSHLGTINRSRAVFLAGGPGYGSDFYPQKFALTHRLEDIKVPVIPLGLGWSGGARESVDNFRFSDSSLRALDWIHERAVLTGVRDEFTLKILRSLNKSGATLTGCPAWYRLPDLEKSFRAPSRYRRIVVSGPGRTWKEAVSVLDLVASVFPKAEKVLSFHRGVGPGRLTGLREGIRNLILRRAALRRGYRILDMAYSAKGLEVYQDFDLHIGYRVHAHIDFLSRRKASVLYYEDGRGEALHSTLGGPAVDARRPRSILELHRVLGNSIDQRFEELSAVTEIMRASYRDMLRVVEQQ